MAQKESIQFMPIPKETHRDGWSGTALQRHH
jgi:hypothetical protein